MRRNVASGAISLRPPEGGRRESALERMHLCQSPIAPCHGPIGRSDDPAADFFLRVVEIVLESAEDRPDGGISLIAVVFVIMEMIMMMPIEMGE